MGKSTTFMGILLVLPFYIDIHDLSSLNILRDIAFKKNTRVYIYLLIYSFDDNGLERNR